MDENKSVEFVGESFGEQKITFVDGGQATGSAKEEGGEPGNTPSLPNA